MELTGKIIQLLPEESGQSARGPWRKQQYILETEGQYPKKVCFMAWGDKIDEFKIQEGDELIVSINIESREYNGRWYTDVKAWKIQRGTASDNQDTQPQQPEAFNQDVPPFDADVPF